MVEHEKKIGTSERALGKLKEESQTAEHARMLFVDELDALKRQVDRTGVDLDGTRAQINTLKKEVCCAYLLSCLLICLVA